MPQRRPNSLLLLPLLLSFPFSTTAATPTAPSTAIPSSTPALSSLLCTQNAPPASCAPLSAAPTPAGTPLSSDPSVPSFSGAVGGPGPVDLPSSYASVLSASAASIRSASSESSASSASAAAERSSSRSGSAAPSGSTASDGRRTRVSVGVLGAAVLGMVGVLFS